MPYKDKAQKKESNHQWYLRNKAKCNQKSHEWYETHKAEMIADSERRRKENPELWKEYQKRYRQTHREQIQGYDKAYWASHRELANTHTHKSRKSHPARWSVYKANRRSREQSSGEPMATRDFENLCALYGNMCLSCFATDVRLTLDHIVPLARGGKNVIENCQPLCKRCNSQKSTRTIDYRFREIHGD